MWHVRVDAHEHEYEHEHARTRACARARLCTEKRVAHTHAQAVQPFDVAMQWHDARMAQLRRLAEHDQSLGLHIAQPTVPHDDVAAKACTHARACVGTACWTHRLVHTCRSAHALCTDFFARLQKANL